jgi:hypothetical protein
MNGQTIGPTTGGGAGGGVVTASDPLGINQSVDNAVASFRKGVMILANMSLFFTAAFLGGVLVLVGLIMIFRETSIRDSAATLSTAGRVVKPVIKAPAALASYWFGPKGERGYDYD